MIAAHGALPVLFGIDVEPDASRPHRFMPGGWEGYEAAHRWLTTLRHALQERTGAAVHYCWYLRMDQQVADLYGSVQYVADRYHRLLAESIQHGDEIGLHPHVHRW